MQSNRIEVSVDNDKQVKSMVVPLRVSWSVENGLTISCTDPDHTFEFAISEEQQLTKFRDKLAGLLSGLGGPLKVSRKDILREMIYQLQTCDTSHELGDDTRLNDRADIQNYLYTMVFNIPFNQPYYQKLVDNDTVPRWKKDIDTEVVKARKSGLIKPTEESDRGYWELTEKGRSLYERNPR